MDVRIHQDPETFRPLATAFYGADTFRHTVALTVMARSFGDESARELTMATIHDGGDNVIGVALRTPPWPLIVSGVPRDAAVLDEFLPRIFDADPRIPAVNGPRENVEAVGAAWVRLTGGTTKEVMATRLYRLGDLEPPSGVAGAPRAMTEDDVELVAGWRDAFEIEVAGHVRAPGTGVAAAQGALRLGDTSVLWEDGGTPVAWAMASAPIGGMSRVGPVFTLSGHRGKGYGSAVTAAATQGALDAGARDVLLFTDLANPTSNSIYQKIGYRPVYDSAEWEFRQLPSTT